MYRFPQMTLILTVAGLLVAVPAWFVTIRRRLHGRKRAIVIGDNSEEIRDVLVVTEIPVVGYISPASPYHSRNRSSRCPRSPTGAVKPRSTI